MPASRIRGDYDILAQIAGIFQQHASQTKSTVRRIKQNVGSLQGGDWVGKGATAFYREMEGEVLPALDRLGAALNSADQTTRQINAILKQAEEEAARILGSDGAAAGALGGAIAAGIAAGVGGAAGQAIGNLLARDPAELFSHDYMQGLIGSQFTGAGSELGNLMDDLMAAQDADSADAIIIVIADLRDRPVDEMRAEYEKFKDVMAERDAAGGPPVAGVGSAHESFNGSNTQMRYGSVVGDAFGIDPVFGSMLNPTGGLVGPGNFAVAGDDTAVGYHGVVHDAAGYLQTYHGVGPGYDYLGVDPIPTSSPLSGQVAGITYWRGQVDSLEPLRSGGVVEMARDAVDIGSWAFDKAVGVF